jgi:hypothetical protein
MPDTPINRPGAPANPPHAPRQSVGIAKGVPDGRTAHEGAHRQTGAGTSPDPANEVLDPHPSDEEHPYREKQPGGAAPPKTDLGPNPAIHDGKAPRRPHNAGSGPE